mmetsp:Transcript_155615/g.290443  ORF Transcript_155615/g.290443 Transcript_155615/m.290443 type:complete len:436 (+) Transcript_155615:95-1402(+)
MGDSQGQSTAPIMSILCRISYYINLLGLKVPLGIMVRASRAKLVLAVMLLAWVPFLGFCHFNLLPKVREAQHGWLVWQLLIAMWVTIPMCVVGSVILFRARTAKLCAMFGTALLCVLLFHKFAIPVLQPTLTGSVLLQVLFAIFEDGSIAGWVWCLVHTVRLQMHIERNNLYCKCPVQPSSADDTVLIIGNAPTVLTGEPLGAVIDTFPEVVRFNGYTLTKPDYTGSRVTSHFCNGRQMPAKSTVQAVLPLFSASLTHAVYLYMPHMEDAWETCEKIMNNKDARFIAEPQILELCKKIKCNFWQIPTSGMVAIDAFLKTYPKVTLHGFNFFAGKKIHYFEESATQLITSWLERFVTHNPPCEKVYVKGLWEQGTADFLSSNVPFVEDVQDSEEREASAESTDEKLDEDSSKLRKRKSPGLLQMVTKDGLPSQFSI